MKDNKWTLGQALDLCKKIEAMCPQYGCHVALTGGVLYNDGPRKDLDLLFYRIRQVESIDYGGLYAALGDIGVDIIVAHGWVTKAEFGGRPIDLFFPDEPYTSKDDQYTSKQDTSKQRERKANDERAVTWYSQGPGGEFDLHTKAEDARAAAESMLEHYEDRAADDGWPEDIGDLEWGRLVPCEVAKIEETPAPEGSGFDAHWDVTLVPYQPKKG